MAVEICSDITNTGYIFTGSVQMGVVKPSASRKLKREFRLNAECTVSRKCENEIQGQESQAIAVEEKESHMESPENEILDIPVSTEEIQDNNKQTVDEFEGMSVLHVSARPGKTISYESLIRKKTDKKRKTRELKAKKWTSVCIEDYGFYPSLFPRPQVSATPDDSEMKTESPPWAGEETVENLCENEFDEIERKLSNDADFELYQKVKVERVRSDRDRKVRKAARQVKDKYCRSLANNRGRKKLYVNHRVYKRMELEPQRQNYLPNQNKLVEKRLDMKEVIAANRKANKASAGKDQPVPPPAANTRHALHSQNAPSTLASDDAYVNLLISLQHRDVTPEDYELLLRLDEQVAPKTISKNTLESFKTDCSTENDCCLQCAICMENYVVGQKRKFLPCDHDFHANCIDMWLQNSSMNCPLDGLPVQQ